MECGTRWVNLWIKTDTLYRTREPYIYGAAVFHIPTTKNNYNYIYSTRTSNWSMSSCFFIGIINHEQSKSDLKIALYNSQELLFLSFL